MRNSSDHKKEDERNRDYSVNEAAVILDRTPMSVYRYVQLGALKAEHVGRPDARKKTYRISAKALADFIEKHQRQSFSLGGSSP